VEHFCRLDPDAARDEKLAKKLEWASQIGEFWVIYQVDLEHSSMHGLLNSWSQAVSPTQKQRVAEVGLDRLCLCESDVAAIERLGANFPPGRVGLSFAGEGLIMCVFGRAEEISAIKKNS
jgi:hypothetical protein